MWNTILTLAQVAEATSIPKHLWVRLIRNHAQIPGVCCFRDRGQPNVFGVTVEGVDQIKAALRRGCPIDQL